MALLVPSRLNHSGQFALSGWCGAAAAVCLGLLLGVPLLHAGVQESPEQILERAVAAHQAGDLTGAASGYRQLIDAGFESSDLLSNLGAAYAGLGDFDNAISTYRQALVLGADSPALHFNLGLAYYKTARFDEALKEFLRVAAADPGNTRARLLAADIEFQSGDNQAVIDLLLPLREQAGKDPAAAYLLGTALLRENRLIEGQRYLDVVLRQPDSLAAHLMLGSAHMTAGKVDEAAEQIRLAIALDPNHPGSHSMLGRVLLQKNDIAGASEAFRKELEINPNDYDAAFHLGSLLKEEQKYDDALVLLERAVRLRPGSIEAAYQMATLHLLRGQLQEARLVLEDLTRREPGFIEAHSSLAMVYYRLEMPEEADRERQIVVKLTAEREAAKPKTRRSIFGGGGELSEESDGSDPSDQSD